MKKGKISPNYEYFLKLNTAPYKGKWLAIAKNKVVASSLRADEAFKITRRKYPPNEISLAKIPQQEAIVLLGNEEREFCQFFLPGP